MASDVILSLILTKPACDSSLVPSIDPLVRGMDVITTLIARSSHANVLGDGISKFKKEHKCVLKSCCIIIIIIIIIIVIVIGKTVLYAP